LQSLAGKFSSLISVVVTQLVAFDSITPLMAHGMMSDFERVKQLLDGDIHPDELELDDELYEMAESIYGREALEEMGIIAPERPTDSKPQSNGDSNHEVEFPKPESTITNDNEIKKPKKRLGIKFIMLVILFGCVLGIGNYLEYIHLEKYIEQIKLTLE